MGACIGGYITQNSHPRYAFLIYSFMGMLCSINALFLKTEIDEEEHDAEIDSNE